MTFRSAGLALAFALACAPASAATPTEAEIAAIQAKLAEGQAAHERGDMATTLARVGEAAMLDSSGEIAHKLGHMLEGMQDLAYHEAEALKWFMVAADRRQADAMHHVGVRYLEGDGGLKRDVGKGLELIDASADAGYHPAYGIAARFRKEQDDKARCALSELRQHRMREVVFGETRFFRITEGLDEHAAGDTFGVEGFSDDFGAALAQVTVDGFSGASYTDVDGTRFYSGDYTPRPASADAKQLAAQVRATCGLPAE